MKICTLYVVAKVGRVLKLSKEIISMICVHLFSALGTIISTRFASKKVGLLVPCSSLTNQPRLLIEGRAFPYVSVGLSI